MRTIRQQLTRKLLSGFAVLLAVGGTGVYVWTRAALVRQFDATLRAKAMAITLATEQDEEDLDVDVTERLAREFDERSATDFFQLWRRDGVTAARSESLGASDLPRQAGTLEAPIFWNLTLPSGIVGRAVGLTFVPRRSSDARRNRNAPRSDVMLVVASDRRNLDRTLGTLALTLLASGVLLLGATMVVVPRVLRRELLPLNRLADQAAGIDVESLSTRFPADGLPDELSPITARLNDLLARLESSFERERRFSADVAHELRTPIAELRSLAELALKWPEARSTDTDRDALLIALQMEGLVTRLLALLRSDRGQLAVSRESVSLAPMFEAVWRPFAAHASAKHLQVTWNVKEGATIQTDPILLRSILTNLLENAVEYSPEHGAVQIDAETPADRVAIRVVNAVDQLGQGDLPKLFDRFWRGDAARAETEHSGLGLSLAQAFARALGCELVASLSGSRLTLTLSGPAR